MFVTIHFVQARGKWTLDAGSSIGFHSSDIYLWNYKIENSTNLGLFIGTGYEQFISKNIGISSSINYYQLFHQVSVGEEEISGTNFILKVPLYGHYHWNKYEVFAGAAIQNYRELKDMALQKSHNFRWQLEAGFALQLNEIWAIKASYSHMLSKQIDSLLALSYTNQISLGVRINLGHLLKRKTDE